MTEPEPDPSKPNPYQKILSLDGGGTWALIQVHALMNLFGKDATGHDVLKHFDLVVANSGGAVVAGAMACNLPLKEIANLFENETARRTIFQEEWPTTVRRGLALPRYSMPAKCDGLRAAIREFTTDAEMTLPKWHAKYHNLPHLMIIGFDYDMERAAFFRSDVKSRAASSSSAAPSSATILDAVHASSNAPVMFFDGPTHVPEGSTVGRRYWDGAIGGYNNPAMAGVVEALANLPDPADRDKIKVLSLGTGTVRRPRRPADKSASDGLYMGGKTPGIIRDLKKLAMSILDDPPDAASFVAHVALGGSLPSPRGKSVTDSPIVRMNPVIRPIKNGDGWAWSQTFSEETWLKLVDLEMDALSVDDVKLVQALCTAWIADAVPNQPIRADDRLEAEIGHDLYGEAREAARKMLGLG